MIAIRTRVRARDITEEHRVSSPLELLFDLTFVVAISSLVAQLVDGVAEGHAADDIGPFLMVFFAIWWAWNQFTWLASAYDNDDVPYRVLTMVQMGGVLVLAAGVPSAFAVQDFTAITLGYLIMRLGLLGTLIRTMIDDPASRPNAQRYVIGIALVQVGWLLRLLFLPVDYVVPAFLVLVALEVLVSPWADRAGSLAWHPHHIAERYGLFAIILLGESVLAVTVAVQEALVDGVNAPLVVVAVSGLILLFTLWWLYFSEPAAEGLVRNRDKSYLWGYGHYFVYAALAAMGAGLEIGVKAVTHHTEIGDVAAGYAIAIPLAVFLLLLWLLHAPLGPVSIPPVATVIASVAILVAPLSAAGIGILGSTVLMTAITVGLLVAALVAARSRLHA